MPGTDITRRRTIQSAVDFSSIGLAVSDRMATNMISPITELAGVMCGGGTSSGSSSVAVWSRSAVTRRACSGSVDQSYSIVTTARPVALFERIRRKPGAPFKAVSSGMVMRCSTSVGVYPPASTTTVTVGAVRSGSTSTGVRMAVHPPNAVNSSAMA